MSYSLIDRGEVLELFISIKGDSNRTSKFSIDMDRDGVVGDKFYAKELNRSVLISTIDSYLLAKRSNIDMDYGSLGENIIMDYNPYALPTGSKIKIGEVVLEISQHCTLCKSLTKVDSKLPKLLKDDRGLFAKVIKSGTIHRGDRVYI
jgi:MOSC domain-containing protein YiiM